MLGSLNYKNVLKRGFAIVKDAAGKPVTLAKSLSPQGVYELVMKDGSRKITVKD